MAMEIPPFSLEEDILRVVAVDQVETGDPLFTIHANDREKLAQAREAILSAHAFAREPVERLPLFYE